MSAPSAGADKGWKTWRSRMACGAIACVACLAAAGCGGGSTGNAGTARVTVTPSLSLATQPVHLTVRGLSAHQVVSLTVTSVDTRGIRWISAETFRASGSGDISVDRAAARSGSYVGVWGMGPIAMMHATSHTSAGAYFWNNVAPRRFTADVSAHGQTLGTTTFARRFSGRPLRRRFETLTGEGFIASFTYATGMPRRPAVLLLGGSEGGVPGGLSASLTARGYPVLALAYFKEPGLPSELSHIPLEYFARALRWLRRQPQVDPHAVAVLGVSRGSEAAQLVGVDYPSLVNAVIALVPSDVAVCSYPGCTGPAWTLHGQAIPFTRQFDDPAPTDQPAAVIPDQRIRGPVFLACASQDRIWTSCPYARAIIQHLDAAHDRFRHTLYRYADAGHGLGVFTPYEPTQNSQPGDSPLADQRARAQDWPRLLRFLAGLGG